MRGFSLVELSIVLVILGLLTGGILAGQSLIRASEIRAVTTEYQRYVTATHSFHDKYSALPGDFKNATQFWGTQDPDAATCKTTASSTTATCDGDGNGKIEAWPTGSNERFRYWQHLANAGLIEGTYQGISIGATDSGTLGGSNAPRSALTNATWYIHLLSITGADTSRYAIDYGHAYELGAENSGVDPSKAALRPEEAWNIDTKIDDGKPGYGNVIARGWNNACATGGASNSDLANSIYNVSDNSLRCALYFRNAF